MTHDFYRNMESFTGSSGIIDDASYASVPGDWYVLAADIVNSSDAIREGRYKEVNFIGAAVITAVLNRLGRDRIPFVFGGDGALLLVAACDLEEGKAALSEIAGLSDRLSGMMLRIAAVPVSDLRAQGADIRVRKYQLSPGNFLAMAIGGGLERAETILKDPDLCAPYHIKADNEAAPLLDGLSCRWEPVMSRNGRIVSLIAKPVGDGAENGFAGLLSGIEQAIGFDPLGTEAEASVVMPERLRFRFPPRKTALEISFVGAAKGKLRAAVKTMVENLAFSWAWLTKRPIGGFDVSLYLDELAQNTDNRKLDDALRLVLDLDVVSVLRLKNFLEGGFEQGRLVYGIHEAGSALITCFVSDLQNGQHIHFVDGSDGGLASAAGEFKKRLKPV
jgi:hypothetical protein